VSAAFPSTSAENLLSSTVGVKSSLVLDVRKPWPRSLAGYSPHDPYPFWPKINQSGFDHVNPSPRAGSLTLALDRSARGEGGAGHDKGESRRPSRARGNAAAERHRRGPGPHTEKPGCRAAVIDLNPSVPDDADGLAQRPDLPLAVALTGSSSPPTPGNRCRRCRATRGRRLPRHAAETPILRRSMPARPRRSWSWQLAVRLGHVLRMFPENILFLQNAID